jgi:hypothetical protein
MSRACSGVKLSTQMWTVRGALFTTHHLKNWRRALGVLGYLLWFRFTQQLCEETAH